MLARLNTNQRISKRDLMSPDLSVVASKVMVFVVFALNKSLPPSPSVVVVQGAGARPRYLCVLWKPIPVYSRKSMEFNAGKSMLCLVRIPGRGQQLYARVVWARRPTIVVPKVLYPMMVGRVPLPTESLS